MDYSSPGGGVSVYAIIMEKPAQPIFHHGSQAK